MWVSNCERLLNVFPSNMIKQLQNLECLEVRDCSSVEVIFDLKGSNSEEGREVEVLPQLNRVYLTSLPELKHILKKGLNLSRGFQNLSLLTVNGCDSLKTIFSASDARGLVMLRDLNITKSQMLEAIFSNRGGEVLKIGLPKLHRLNLNDLPNLVGFCDSVDEVELPQLEELLLKGVSKFGGVYRETDISGSEHHHASPECLSFKPMVTLTNLLKRLQNLREIFVFECDLVEMVFNLQELNFDGGFQNLRSLSFCHCDSLRQLFTPSMAKILVKLENIELSYCKLLEAIVAKEERGGEEEEEGILFPQLTTLELRGLPKLLTLAPKAYTFNWSYITDLTMVDCGRGLDALTNERSEDNIGPKEMDNLNDKCERGTIVAALKSEVIQQLQNLKHLELGRLNSIEPVFSLQGPPSTIRGFQNMKRLTINECDSLRHLFTSSMAKILVGLEALKVSECKLLEAIVAEEEGGAEGILFPKLNSINLEGLPNLLTIMPRNFNCSSLKYLSVTDCGKGAKARLNDKLDEVDQQVTSSCSTGAWEVSKMDTTLFTTNVIQPRLQNLWKVYVEECGSVEVVFDLQGLDVKYEGRELLASELRHITLNYLPKLTNIWKRVPHNIQGFQYLQYLTVKGCDNLRYLFTPSIAKNLVGLVQLKINDCKLLEAIVADEEYCATTETVILFPRLTKIFLAGLPNMMTIAPKAYKVDWTCMEYLLVDRCGEGADTLTSIILHLQRVALATSTAEFDNTPDRKWPELVGLPAEEAVRKIKKDMHWAHTAVVSEHALFYKSSFHIFAEVLIVIDSSEKVIRPPRYI